MAATASSTDLVSNAASTTAAIRLSLSGKTRKIVPSAMPAASAICRVVTAAPCASSSGNVAATISARRSEGGRAAARLVVTGPGYMSESSLTHPGTCAARSRNQPPQRGSATRISVDQTACVTRDARTLPAARRSRPNTVPMTTAAATSARLPVVAVTAT